MAAAAAAGGGSLSPEGKGTRNLGEWIRPLSWHNLDGKDPIFSLVEEAEQSRSGLLQPNTTSGPI